MIEWVEIDGFECAFKPVQDVPGRAVCVGLVLPKRDGLCALYAVGEVDPDGFRTWHQARSEWLAKGAVEQLTT